MIQDTPTDQTILSISELNSQARHLIETHFPRVWVSGEISNFSCPRSGHWYFSLKDDRSQIRAAMFKGRNRTVKRQPSDGSQVLIQGRLSLYTPRGDFQLIVDHMEDSGEGALRRAFEALKQRLEKQGLFDEQNKQPIPDFPGCIGVITSPTGAAIRDIIHVLSRRAPALSVIIYPVAVQGEVATEQIATAIATANRRRDCDVLILARGGGSLEDLWSFNEERVAQSMAASQLPIITGIGHQTDFTIADFVADLRAPTPSAAAEMASPNTSQWIQQIQQLFVRLTRAMLSHIENLAQDIDYLQQRLKHPGQQLQEYAVTLSTLEHRLLLACQTHLDQQAHQWKLLVNRLHHRSPTQTIATHQVRVNAKAHQLNQAIQVQLQQTLAQFQHLSQQLHTVSPPATLERGFSITQSQDENVITDANDVSIGQHIIIRMAKGELECVVEVIHPQV